MPHVDTLSVAAAPFPGRESPFARPVAAVTAFVVGAFRRRRPSAEVRELEAAHARAADHRDLERMQQEWAQRDGGGMRTWDWR